MKKLLMLLVMAMLFSFGCNITTDDGSAEDGSAVDTPVSTVEADDSATDSATLAAIFQGAKVVRADELPACEAKLKGQLFYLSDLAQFQYCDGAAYQVIDLTGAKGDKGDAGATGAAGADGAKGDPGVAGPAGPEGVTGADGSSCSVTDNNDGTKTINCTDGTSATVSDGADGTGGSGFSVRGTVSNLGTGKSLLLVLKTNFITYDYQYVITDGNFAFPRLMVTGVPYQVTVWTQPELQECSVTNATGTISADVNDIEISCLDTFSVGGTVSGLDMDKSVTLSLTGGQTASVSANGDFSFTDPIADGTEYTVAVSTFPESQSCVVTNGTGTISSNVSDVAVSCSARYTDNNDGTIADARLNLTWKKCSEGQTDDATCSGTASRYEYCTVNDNSCNGGVDDGILDSGPLFDACDALNTSSYGGKTTWRVPTLDELRTLISGSSAPYIDTNVFPGTVSDYYWSASSFYSYLAWSVYFSGGYASYDVKANVYYVRCVSPDHWSFGDLVIYFRTDYVFRL